MALGLNSWGLTIKILAQTLDLEGTRLVPPRILLQWQHGQAFVNFFKAPHSFHGVISSAYHKWGTPLGICTSLVNFHLFQLATVKLSGLPFIGMSALSFSRARRGAVVETPPNLPLAVPLWHNVLFRNRDGNTYYSPELVRNGVLTTAQISEGTDGEEDFVQALPMLTKTVYRSACKKIRRSEGSYFAPYHLPEFWQNWTKTRKRVMARHLSTAYSLCSHPQTTGPCVGTVHWPHPLCWLPEESAMGQAACGC